MALAKFDENSVAFKNLKKFFITDIPLDLRGLKRIKFPTRYHSNYISFHVNAPIYVYIGVLSHYPNPLPDFFQNMQQIFQLVEIVPDAKKRNVKHFI